MAGKQASISRKRNPAEHLQPWQFKPGVSGNPSGKPTGTVSLKTRVQNMLLNMSDVKAAQFLKGIDKKVIWEMAEGKPQADITSGGKPIEANTVVIKRYGGEPGGQ